MQIIDFDAVTVALVENNIRNGDSRVDGDFLVGKPMRHGSTKLSDGPPIEIRNKK